MVEVCIKDRTQKYFMEGKFLGTGLDELIHAKDNDEVKRGGYQLGKVSYIYST